MREILFRGKRVDNGEWAEGFPIIYSNGICVICNEYVRNENVIPKTVGQYTGLTDKNGKKIFEGDIVKVPDIWHGGYYKVAWWSDASFKLTKNDRTYYCIDTAIEKGCEVIGNIHDNPELLEEQGNA